MLQNDLAPNFRIPLDRLTLLADVQRLLVRRLARLPPVHVIRGRENLRLPNDRLHRVAHQESVPLSAATISTSAQLAGPSMPAYNDPEHMYKSTSVSTLLSDIYHLRVMSTILPCV